MRFTKGDENAVRGSDESPEKEDRHQGRQCALAVRRSG